MGALVWRRSRAALEQIEQIEQNDPIIDPPDGMADWTLQTAVVSPQVLLVPASVSYNLCWSAFGGGW